jgi:hypothetical protein
VGSLNGRVRRLEERYGIEDAEEGERVSEERRAALKADLQHGRERAEREAAAGDSRRLRALELLEQSIKRRRGHAS